MEYPADGDTTKVTWFQKMFSKVPKC